jgi:hypothetical protein
VILPDARQIGRREAFQHVEFRRSADWRGRRVGDRQIGHLVEEDASAPRSYNFRRRCGWLDALDELEGTLSRGKAEPQIGAHLYCGIFARSSPPARVGELGVEVATRPAFQPEKCHLRSFGQFPHLRHEWRFRAGTAVAARYWRDDGRTEGSVLSDLTLAGS